MGRNSRTALWLATAILATPAVAGSLRVPQDHATITAALAAAAPGDSILVAAGTYSPVVNGESFPLVMAQAGLSLLGQGADVTTLDAMGTAGVLLHTASLGGRVSGFRITGGRSALGGGVRVLAGTVEIDHNRFVGNGASVGGAAISTHGTSVPWIHHNEILDHFSTSAADVHALRLNGHTAGRFEHNLVAHSDGNGLLTVDSVTTEVRNNIFYRNGIPDPPRGRGLCWISDLPARVHHNLFFENQVAAMFWSTGGGDFDAATADAYSLLDGVHSNLEQDPLFRDGSSGDFHLLGESPAIDAGDPAAPLDPDGTVADIGPHAHTRVTHVPATGGTGALTAAPNPSRGASSLRWVSPRTARVRLEVLDLSGRVVRTWGTTEVPAGAHQWDWDGRDGSGTRVGPGLYLAVAHTAAARVVTKLVVVR